MSRVIFDIETVGVDFDDLDASQQEYLLRYAETEGETRKVKDSLGLSPLTGEIVAIGMLNPETLRGAVFFQAPGSAIEPFEEEGIKFETGTEREILEKFQDVIKSYSQFVTFNGRTFDCPYILVRSAVHKVKPARDLMPNRYSGPHIDLLDQLSFYGATKRYSLDMWCRALNIKSPKEEGITGLDVKGLFEEGRFVDIARYCLRDILATRELLLRWESYIKFTS
ncbi:putative 3'-5' exonuclease related to the exonuclease domain of PolB [bacterium BMS3Bbin06]|nr:putative 3'-5' exonuclease related to the exonuclease domain of PolB [bacterium BMS3Abin08]GBE35850.1 putative 3'-5' exonuclease related to the exonuclease domain of PolB [bacterium BMS3Bbin06]HDO36167.1 3'-5' exonuclease [Nitrospirota bacterium]HDY72281.1 3'-5' exonuclease [Nitrospirota bacterium]